MGLRRLVSLLLGNPLGVSAFAAIEVITYALERPTSKDHWLQPQFESIVKGRSVCSKSAAGFLVMIETAASTGEPRRLAAPRASRRAH